MFVRVTAGPPALAFQTRSAVFTKAGKFPGMEENPRDWGWTGDMGRSLAFEWEQNWQAVRLSGASATSTTLIALWPRHDA